MIGLAKPILDIERAESDKVFLSSDWHLNHENLLYFTKRGGWLRHDMRFKKMDVDCDCEFGVRFRSDCGCGYTYIGRSAVDNIPMFIADGDGKPSVLFDGGGAEHAVSSVLDITEAKDKRRCDIVEYNHTLIERVNEVVGEDDTLINCGDVIIGRTSELGYYIDKIRCRNIIIVLGNHDVNNMMRKLRLRDGEGCKVTVTNMLTLRVSSKKKVLYYGSVSHAPLETFTGSFNIHGHLHSTQNLDDYKDSPDYNIAVKYKATGKHFDCGLERNGFRPVCLTDILGNKTDIRI